MESHQTVSIPGDGTSNLLNRAAPLLLLFAGVAAFEWWLKWIRTRHIVTYHSNSYLILVCLLLSMLIVMLHELGHSAVGLALGMKLRAFAVGPFHWRIRDGQWEFQFEPLQILAERGATRMAPTVPKFPRWAYLLMLSGVSS